MDFKLVSSYKPQGDQGRAIESLLRGVYDREQHQVLLGRHRVGQDVHHGQGDRGREPSDAGHGA